MGLTYTHDASLLAQLVKNPPATWETWAQEDPLEKGMATHSSILVWRIQESEIFTIHITIYKIS